MITKITLDNCMNRDNDIDKKYSIRYSGLHYKLKNIEMLNEWYEDLSISYGSTSKTYRGTIKERFSWLDELDIALLMNHGSNWFGGESSINKETNAFSVRVYTD